MTQGGSVHDALARARVRGLDRLDAQLLLGHVLARPRSWLLAHGEVAVDALQWQRFDEALQRRLTGVPLAYLTGEKEFHGLSLRVSPDVLVPRPDTETLVDWALDLLRPPGPLAGLPVPRVLDLGTGSGAIALALKHALPVTQVSALDCSAAALGVARGNAQRLGLDVDFLESHWWSAVGTQRFDLLVSNPPYIADDDPHLAALVHEPQPALGSGPDGLADLRLVIAGAPQHLQAGGWIVLEHGHEQGEAVRGLLQEAGFDSIATRLDLGSRPRCSAGRIAAI